MKKWNTGTTSEKDSFWPLFLKTNPNKPTETRTGTHVHNTLPLHTGTAVLIRNI